MDILSSRATSLRSVSPKWSSAFGRLIVNLRHGRGRRKLHLCSRLQFSGDRTNGQSALPADTVSLRRATNHHKRRPSPSSSLVHRATRAANSQLCMDISFFEARFLHHFARVTTKNDSSCHAKTPPHPYLNIPSPRSPASSHTIPPPQCLPPPVRSAVRGTVPPTSPPHAPSTPSPDRRARPRRSRRPRRPRP